MQSQQLPKDDRHAASAAKMEVTNFDAKDKVCFLNALRCDKRSFK
jgi:hypothetical protein